MFPQRRAALTDDYLDIEVVRFAPTNSGVEKEIDPRTLEVMVRHFLQPLMKQHQSTLERASMAHVTLRSRLEGDRVRIEVATMEWDWQPAGIALRRTGTARIKNVQAARGALWQPSAIQRGSTRRGTLCRSRFRPHPRRREPAGISKLALAVSPARVAVAASLMNWPTLIGIAFLLSDMLACASRFVLMATSQSKPRRLGTRNVFSSRQGR